MLNLLVLSVPLAQQSLEHLTFVDQKLSTLILSPQIHYFLDKDMRELLGAFCNSSGAGSSLEASNRHVLRAPPPIEFSRKGCSILFKSGPRIPYHCNGAAFGQTRTCITCSDGCQRWRVRCDPCYTLNGRLKLFYLRGE